MTMLRSQTEIGVDYPLLVSSSSNLTINFFQTQQVYELLKKSFDETLT